MLTGLLGNALGYEHRDADRLGALQARLRYAVRVDRNPERLTDFQTVDLGQAWMETGGWTTAGAVDQRGKGDATSGTHIRYRDFWADGVFTIVVGLVSPDGEPTVDQLEAALLEPARPLFIGRKTCLPAAPILLGRARANGLVDALRAAPPITCDRWRGEKATPLLAWWPDDEGEPSAPHVVPVVDERDWANQIHVGRRMVRQGLIELTEGENAR